MAYFTVQRELVDPDYYDGVVASRREDLQFQTIVGRLKGKQPLDWEQKVQVASFPKAYDAAVAEGVDFDKTSIGAGDQDFVLSHVMEIFRSKGYRVTRHRQAMPGHNDKKGMTAAQKKVKDAQDLLLSVEIAALSAQELTAYGSTKKPIMRGAFNWLQKGAHSVSGLDVPEKLRPVAGYEADVTDLTEELFRAECIKAKKQRGTGNMALVGMVGIDLKGIMSGWLAAASNINSGKLVRTQDADKKTLQLICDDFVFDGVRVHVLNDDHVNIPMSGDGAFNPSEASYLSGIFIDPTMWGFSTLMPLEHFDIKDEGAGPGGWHETTLRLTCLNPMGQFRVNHVAA